MLLVVAGLLSGFLPLAMPFGWAAGGVLETGQVAPMRWWAGASGVLIAYGLMSWRWPMAARLWWFGCLAGGLALSILLFSGIASSGSVMRAPSGPPPISAGKPVGVLSALPLFWREGAGDISAGAGPIRMAPRFTHLPLWPIDHADARSLGGFTTMLIAQPRLLQPQELVAIDDWVRAGGKAVVLADPLLMWPSDLPPGDARRAPLTSLLDPLLMHWGLRLEPAEEGARGVERRLLDSGHVLLLAGASRFTKVAGGNVSAQCELIEHGLIALCRIGKGAARLVADADLIDEQLWLTDARWPDRPAAHTSDISALMDAWLVEPLDQNLPAPVLRIRDDAALIVAMRWALLAGMAWVVLGWVGYRLIMHGSHEGSDPFDIVGQEKKAGNP